MDLRIGSHYSQAVHVETVNGTTLNRESGGLLQNEVTFTVGPRYGLSYELFYRGGSSDLLYKGASQQGLLFSTTTEYALSDWQGRVAWHNNELGFYGGLGYNYRERNIVGNQIIEGLYEELNRYYWLLGSEWSPFQGERYRVTLNAQLQRSYRVNLVAEFSGLYDSADGQAGVDWSTVAEIEFYLRLGGGWGLSFIPSYQYTHIDASEPIDLYQNGDTTGLSFYLPETKFEYTALRLLLSKRF